jgi:nitrite reductase/ring-hydroxylating ferredoxin subunit/uncharacterized membrane protein
MAQALLEGKPLRHPLHPLLVHVPIGLFVLSFLLDLGTLAQDANWMVRGAFYAMVGGVLTALAAALPGFVDYFDIRRDHPGKRPATYHMLLNLAAVALYTVNLFLRYGERDASATPAVPLVLSLVGVGLLSVSGYIGGVLIYDDGIAVGRHRRRTPTPRATLTAAPAGPPDGFATVADANALAEGATLRAEVGGVVMTLVKLGGEVYAFQEFCTHRYGPLSEGTFEGGQVMCPWHRSCFDVRTGRVTQGPANVDLRTFEARVRDGKIEVRIPAG